MQKEDDREEERKHMVLSQLVRRGIQSSDVLEAMRTVPRHRFIPENLQNSAYEDGPLPIGEGQTISQPYIVALMTEYCHPHKNAKALEIGTGSGYAASVLSRVCKEVFTIERHRQLSATAQKCIEGLGYKNITFITGDGTLGVPEYAPYDCIIVTAGAPAVPSTLKQQLAIGGTLVIPVGDMTAQRLLCIKRLSETDFSERTIESVRFVPLIGKEGW